MRLLLALCPDVDTLASDEDRPDDGLAISAEDDERELAEGDDGGWPGEDEPFFDAPRSTRSRARPRTATRTVKPAAPRILSQPHRVSMRRSAQRSRPRPRNARALLDGER